MSGLIKRMRKRGERLARQRMWYEREMDKEFNIWRLARLSTAPDIFPTLSHWLVAATPQWSRRASHLTQEINLNQERMRSIIERHPTCIDKARERKVGEDEKRPSSNSVLAEWR